MIVEWHMHVFDMNKKFLMYGSMTMYFFTSGVRTASPGYTWAGDIFNARGSQQGQGCWTVPNLWQGQFSVNSSYRG